MTIELEKSCVYGPVKSRRFGWDVGINLLPTNRKLCTFDCIYCQYGFTGTTRRNQRSTFPQTEEIIAELEEKIRLAEQSGITVTHATLSGNGEPTMHPDFARVTRNIFEWRNQNIPQMKLALLSNGYRLQDPEIRLAVGLLDEPFIKLDSAISDKLKLINRPIGEYSLSKLIENLQKCSGIMIQTMFLKGWNDGRWDILRWQNALLQIQPKAVQIYSVARSTPWPDLAPLNEGELLRIANETTRLLNIPVQAFV